MQMVRAAGTPAIMYGCDCFGLSDSALHTARVKVVSAVAAPTEGKCVEVVLHLMDGVAGTLDPAFEAHASLLLLWAMAIWEGWFSREQLAKAFSQASLKLAKREGLSCWSLVTGPATALLASMARIGWLMPNAFEVIDDQGIAWNLLETSPGAMAAVVRDAVRRWRLDRIGRAMPGLIPRMADVGDPNCPKTILFDMSFAMQPYIRGKGVGAASTSEWQPAWGHSLLSGAVDGQWTQARKAAVPAWGITDTQCQLCHTAVGTPSIDLIALRLAQHMAGPRAQARRRWSTEGCRALGRGTSGIMDCLCLGSRPQL